MWEPLAHIQVCRLSSLWTASSCEPKRVLHFKSVRLDLPLSQPNYPSSPMVLTLCLLYPRSLSLPTSLPNSALQGEGPDTSQGLPCLHLGAAWVWLMGGTLWRPKGRRWESWGCFFCLSSSSLFWFQQWLLPSSDVAPTSEYRPSGGQPLSAKVTFPSPSRHGREQPPASVKIPGVLKFLWFPQPCPSSPSTKSPSWIQVGS